MYQEGHIVLSPEILKLLKAEGEWWCPRHLDVQMVDGQK